MFQGKFTVLNVNIRKEKLYYELPIQLRKQGRVHQSWPTPLSPYPFQLMCHDCHSWAKLTVQSHCPKSHMQPSRWRRLGWAWSPSCRNHETGAAWVSESPAGGGPPWSAAQCGTHTVRLAWGVRKLSVCHVTDISGLQYAPDIRSLKTSRRTG